MMVVMIAVGWELFREVEGLVMSPLLQCVVHAHPDLMIIENEGNYKGKCLMGFVFSVVGLNYIVAAQEIVDSGSKTAIFLLCF